MGIYIHEKEDWTAFTWNHTKITVKLGEARNKQGRLLGKMEIKKNVLQKELSGGRSTNYELRSRDYKKI